MWRFFVLAIVNTIILHSQTRSYFASNLVESFQDAISPFQSKKQICRGSKMSTDLQIMTIQTASGEYDKKWHKLEGDTASFCKIDSKQCCDIVSNPLRIYQLPQNFSKITDQQRQVEPFHIYSLVGYLLALFNTFPRKLQGNSFYLFAFLYLSMNSVTAQPSTMTPACTNCPACLVSVPNTCVYCTFGYYYTSTCLRYTNMPGCTAANGKKCTSCNSSYFLGASSTCTSCASAIVNCQSCTNSSVCSQCMSGYTVNLSSLNCDICSLTLPNCTKCNSKTICTNCVDQTFFLNSTSKCELCSSKKTGCRRCTSTSCIQCKQGYYLLNSSCHLCNSALQGCAICPNSTICTRCVSTAYVHIGNACIPCDSIFPFCQNCSLTTCTACKSNFFLNTTSQCRCKKGQLVDNQCIDIAGCTAAIQFSSISYCTQCDQNIFLFNTSTLVCDCKIGFLLNNQCSVLYGCISMIMVNNKSTCLMCNKSRHFTVKNGSCSCDFGHYLEKGDNACYQTCGDGILFYLQCDDGNLIDGDGCNSLCKIEESFICSGGNQSVPSHCLNQVENFELQVEQIENVGEYNIAKFQFRIINYVQFLHTLNWTKIFSLDIDKQHNVTSVSITGNKVTFIVEYFQDLEGFPAVFHLNLDSEYFLYKKVISLPFLMVSQTAPLVVTEYPSQLILDILSKILFALSILSLLLLLFAPCVHKMIALETITVLQLCNLAPFLIPGDSLSIRVFSSLSLSNGFGRQLFTDPKNSDTFGTAFEHMSLAKTFTQNMLINESLLFTVVLIFVILYLLKEKTDNKETSKLVRKNIYHFAYVYLWNLVFSISMALFLSSFVALSCNNHRVYETTYNGIKNESTKKYKLVNSNVDLLSIFMVFSFIVSLGFINIFIFFSQPKILEQYKSKIIQIIHKEFERLNVKNKIYVSMFVINLFATFTFLSGFFFIAFKYKLFIYFLTSLPYSIIVIFFRPYNKFIDNLGICLGQFITIVFISGLCVKQYFRIIKTPLSLKYDFYFCIGIVILLTIFVIIQVFRLFITWMCYNKYKPIKSSNKQKKADTKKRSDERVDIPFEDQGRKDYFLKRLKLQEITAVDTAQLLRLKDRLRDSLFEKRNIQDNVRILSDSFGPSRQSLI